MAERKKASSEPAVTPAPSADQETPKKTENASKSAESEASKPTSAAPLDPPIGKPVRADVTVKGVAPNATTPQTFAKEGSVRLLDDDGNEVNVDELFDYPAADNPGTLATVRTRVYREYRASGSRTVMKQLLYPAGALVPIFDANRVRAEHRQQPAEQSADATPSEG